MEGDGSWAAGYTPFRSRWRGPAVPSEDEVHAEYLTGQPCARGLSLSAVLEVEMRLS